MSSESLHEDPDGIGPEAVDLHRAIVSLMEEFEAVDWHSQRARPTSDPELRAIFEHNRDEEKEYAAMALEWMRRCDSTLDEHLRTCLFTDAPITPAGWSEIETEAKRTLRAPLSARRVVDFNGPLGWSTSDVELGRADPIASPLASRDVQARLRRIQPLVELCIPLDVSRMELDAIDRGARDLDLDSVTATACTMAIAEDRAIFDGYEAAHIAGICEARKSVGVPLGASHTDYPLAVASALTKLRDDGIEGPFSVVLNEQLYMDLSARTDGGYPIISHVQRLIDGEIVWAPGIDGGLALSMRGGDFELSVGQGFSVGYLEHDIERVRLYTAASFTFLVLTEQAAIPLGAEGRKER